MDALYRYGSPYGMGEEPPQTSGEPGQPVQPTMWQSIKNISADLIKQGVKAAPALIQAKLQDKMASQAGAVPGLPPKPKAKKPKAAPPAAAPTPGLPGWVIPVALGGAVLVGGIFLLRRRKG